MKYLFTTRHDSSTTGIVVDLADQQQAWREAVTAAGEALQDMDGHLGIPGGWTMEVSNDAGDRLFEIRVETRRLSDHH